MALAAAIRHVAFEDLGSLAPVLKKRGYDIRYYEAGVDDLAEAGKADILLMLGGPISVNDANLYPFIKEELRVAEQRLTATKPMFGLCLGAQMIAAALGAKIYPAAVKEIGWNKISLTLDGRNSPLRHIGEDEPVLHWHGDTFDMPRGALWLASTPEVPHQAFSVGANILALQFHPEAVGRRIEQWLIGHTCELALNKIDIAQIRADTKRWKNSLTSRGAALFDAWLDGVQSSRVNSSSPAAA